MRRFVPLCAIAATAAQAAPIPTRIPLATIPVAPAKTVSRVETTRVDFAPGQAMPAHMHNVPVVCFVVRGDFLYRIGDAPERSAATGAVTFEPPGVRIHYFRNASASTPAQLDCASLAGDADTVLNVPLEKGKKAPLQGWRAGPGFGSWLEGGVRPSRRQEQLIAPSCRETMSATR